VGKLIIENRSNLNDLIALEMVQGVIQRGRISNNDKQYCYVSVYDLDNGSYAVVTDLNKKSDRFVIYKEPNK